MYLFPRFNLKAYSLYKNNVRNGVNPDQNAPIEAFSSGFSPLAI